MALAKPGSHSNSQENPEDYRFVQTQYLGPMHKIQNGTRAVQNLGIPLNTHWETHLVWLIIGQAAEATTLLRPALFAS